MYGGCLVILLWMQDPWSRLAAPFPDGSHTWRVLEISSDGRRARLRPQLSYQAVCDRLDQEVGVGRWSNAFRPVGTGAIACELTVEGVTKSAVAASLFDGDAQCLSEDSLVRAAELFGMRVGIEAGGEWVDYDAEEGRPLYEPAPASDSVAEPAKTEGQKAIDRLVDRLRDLGRSEEAARLLVEYGGYGHDPDASRELYGKLRALLKGPRRPVNRRLS